VESHDREATEPTLVFSCDGDGTIREGDWLRLWNSHGIGVAHDIWVAKGGIVYENSGPGGFVRRNFLGNVLAGRRVIHILARTSPGDLDVKIAFAESRLGTPWASLYNCQDFASEVATGRAESFQRDAIVGVTLSVALVAALAGQLDTPKRSKSRRN
jgi:hypothetical protein